MVKSPKKAKNNKQLLYTAIIVLLAIAAIVAALIAGYMLGKGLSSEKPVAQQHTHNIYEVQPGEITPIIDSIDIKKDSKMGWNLALKTSNFKFTPENVNQDHVAGEGHAHLYINDEKITRLYSNNYYIKGYEEGIHKVVVTLNTNNHADYYVMGQQIKAEAKIVGSHGHDIDTEQEHEH